MRDEAREGAEFARTHDRADLDRWRWLGLVKSIEVIGEAATRLTPDFRQRHPEIAWTRIMGMRHRLVHDYDQINYDIVWETATRDLPPLAADLDRILAAWPDPPTSPGRVYGQ